jgi:integrase
VQLRKGENDRNATSGRLPNNVYRIREHLTEAEVDKLLAALKRNRHGHRDWLVGLIIYRHGLRVSEACDLRWDDIDLSKRTIIVRRLKGSTDSVHYLERDEVNGLKLLRRQQETNGIKSAYVFVNERSQPFGRMTALNDPPAHSRHVGSPSRLSALATGAERSCEIDDGDRFNWLRRLGHTLHGSRRMFKSDYGANPRTAF